MKKIFLFALLALLFAACSDDNDDNGGNAGFKATGQGVFICNEGMFDGTGTLSFYDLASGEVYNDVYANANNGTPLGQFCQSMSIIDGKGFLAINGDNRITVINPVTFEGIKEIEGVYSPREVTAISSGKLYYRSMFRPFVYVADRTDYSLTGTAVFPEPEARAGTPNFNTSGSYYYTFDWSNGDQVYKIDIATDKVVDSLMVTYQPNSLAIDKNDKLWVLSDGGYEGAPRPKEIPALAKIDLATFTVEDVLEFPSKQYAPMKLTMNGGKDMLYFGNEAWDGTAPSPGVYAMNVTADALPTQPLIASADEALYGMGVSPANGDIYLSYALDYSSSGTVYRYDKNGAKIDEFKVGICPGSFCFKTE